MIRIKKISQNGEEATLFVINKRFIDTIILCSMSEVILNDEKMNN